MKTAQYQAYALANQTAPKTRQIVMLYDGAIRYLRQARDAMEIGRIEERYNLLLKTSEVVMGLQGCLDFDEGGEVAKILFDFYSSIDTRLLALHGTPSLSHCDQIITELKQMRDVWAAIDLMRSGDTHGSASITSEAAADTAPLDSGVGISA